MRFRNFILFVFGAMFQTSFAQLSCFDAANKYRAKYLEQTPIDFDTLSFYLRKSEGMLIGCTFPNDTILTIKNKTQYIEEYKGKVLVINFWSIHCPPCVNEIHSFDALQKKYSRLSVIAATLDNKNELESWLQKHSFKADIIPNAVSFVHRYSLGNGYPFTLVVDPTGKIVYTKSGGETGKEHQLDLYKELSPIVEKALGTR